MIQECINHTLSNILWTLSSFFPGHAHFSPLLSGLLPLFVAKTQVIQGQVRGFVGGGAMVTKSDKEREGKEGRRLKWILFNVFRTILVECNERNVSGNGNNRFYISLFISLPLSLPPSNILIHLLCSLIFFTFFSPPLGDGDYICAGSHREYELYIWDKVTGNLVKILTGPKGKSLLDLTWHPVTPVKLSVSNRLVNIWSHAQITL